MPAREALKNAYLPLVRVHCTEAYRWGHSAATDYWLSLNSGFDILAAASTATGEQLAENGWTSTSLVNTAGAAQDFMGGTFTYTAGNGPKGVKTPVGNDIATPNHILTDASGDLLASPAFIGDYLSAYRAMVLAGKNVMPRFLVGEFIAAFTVASANEAQSAFGFFEDGATVSVAADQYACISSNATNFLLQGNASTMVTGPAIDTNWHHWRIVLQYNGATAPNVYAYQDGVIFSTTAGVGIQDEFPLKFGLHSLTTNRIGLGMAHLYYDW